jgi:serine protease Do
MTVGHESGAKPLEPMAKTNAPSRDILGKVLHSVVQVVALKRGMFGNFQPAWTGSGTIVDSRGLVLTNCHVASPRSMGMNAPDADYLGIALTNRSDSPPALTYLAEIASASPELDLAVLRIVAQIDGNRVSNLNLPAIPIGDSDRIELGESVAVFGYPGIGGATITFTSGSVSGFTSEQGVNARRAWIKTDAAISGGNSGGTAVDESGALIGVPTQAAAGAGIKPVDARPVVDTNQDGRVDQYDSPIAIGGFINGLRPVNLAKQLLEQAGANIAAAPRSPLPQTAPGAQPGQAAGGTDGIPSFGALFFSAAVTPDSRPINPAALLPSGGDKLYATFDFDDMAQGMRWSQTWALNGKVIYQKEEAWDGVPSGRKTLVLGNKNALPEGMYHLALTISGAVVLQGNVTIGKHAYDNDSEISGQVVDQASGQGIGNALVIVLKPGISVQQFAAVQSKDMAVTSVRSAGDGSFTLPQQLPKGQAYSLVVVAQGFADLAVDGALRIGPDAPENARISPIPLTRA